jgi:uncharacterized protein (DUF1800 family)
MVEDIIVSQPISYSMNPYTGSWTVAEAAHLLRRTMFGATYQQIQSAVSNGMDLTVSTLLTIPALPSEPLTYDPDEAVVSFGATWVNSVYDTIAPQTTENARYRSLKAWMNQRLNSTSYDISEKMCLFWQNHFAVYSVGDSRATYNYLNLLRNHALGDFRQLIKDITIDPAMLLFLNGKSNTGNSPNENFSRELLELYTLGKGDQIGPGDYSTYTEGDVAAGARILSGWQISGYRSDTLTTTAPFFTSTRHDSSTKTLSNHFAFATVADLGAVEYEYYVDQIFQHPACATFICKKLYRYFVNYDLTTNVLNNIIPLMAQTLLVNNFNILPVMNQLLKSQHFYDISVRGALIKSPIEAIFSWFNASESSSQFDLDTDYKQYIKMNAYCSALGQEYLRPPSVGGWTSYYQAPSYYKLWLNSTNLNTRFAIATKYTQQSGISYNGNAFKINALTLVDGLSIPNDAISVIEDLCIVFFPKSVSQAEKDNLRLILTNGLPDFEWTIQYNDYTANPGVTGFSGPVRMRVEFVLCSLFKMAQSITA